ncbi:hypothetical protein B0A55_08777 [Friedmanniomyces simplex]|uniref:Xylanolytic transcriptional activator regulatory domain-containing protein n=1 Tax=Friedmanniomyces simplex TaxID=329884 RepID=A0A4U0WUC3_9PEZI|nr:hypothetical protein B0A55_08777 [Friedmanniomyces simplex]
MLIFITAETPGEVSGQCRHSSNTEEHPNDVRIPTARLETMEARIAALSDMVHVLQTQTSSGVASSAARSTTDLSGANVNEPDPAPDSSGHLSRQEGGRMRYVDQTYWASMCQEVSELDGLLSGQARYVLHSATDVSDQEDDIDPEFDEDSVAAQRRNDAGRLLSDLGQPTTRGAGASVPTRSHQQLTGDIVSQPLVSLAAAQVTTRTVARNPEFLRQLPSKRRCDALLEGYIHGYHPIVPMIHVPTFRHRYEEFWRTRNDVNAGETASMSFAALLVAILYAGSVACPLAVSSGAIGAPEPDEAATHLQKLATRALRLSNFPRTPTLDSFRAYLICQTTWAREEEPLSCVAFVGVALRVATMLGLHKDPSHFPSVNAIEAEVRRRVWWHLVHIDVLVAAASGLPPMVDLDCWDVRGISELKEEHFGTSAGRTYEELVKTRKRPHDGIADPRGSVHNSLISTIGVLVAGKLRASLVLRRTLTRLSTRGALTTAELVAMRSEFRLLSEDLAARIARIPEPDPADAWQSATDSTYENNLALNRWARLLLSAYVDVQYCTAYHGVLKAPVSEIWPELYPQAIEHCQSFLTKCAQMASISDFSNFQWSWPGQRQPLHAIMILLIDLLQNPHNARAVASRKALDICFALCGPHGGLVGGGTGPETTMKRPLTEGGQEAWVYFRRLRTKAWQNAGLDAEIVWTREQAVRYCNQQGEPEIVVDDGAGPMWGQSSPTPAIGGVFDRSGAPQAVPSGEEYGGAMSPPSIDWTYLDAVLEGNRHVDLEFDFDPDNPAGG